MNNLCCFWGFLLISVVMSASHAEALTMSAFDMHTSVDLKYADRVCMSTDISDADFLCEASSDHDRNGVIDLLEERSFFHTGDALTCYIGNQHNRYALSNVLVAVAVVGECDGFMVNDLRVTENDFVRADDPAVFWGDERVCDVVDWITLVSLDTRIEDRDPNGSAIGENDVYRLTISDVTWVGSVSPRLYCTAFGVLSSGAVNSYSPANSDVLFMPTRDAEDNGAVPVPEPTMLGLVACGLLFITMKEQKGERDD